MSQIPSERENFSDKLGFILACVGSAVGIGNIWLFPYRLGQYGGASFLIPYIFFLVLLGYSGVVGEMAFGRAMKTGPLGAFKSALKMRGIKHGHWLGLIPLIGCLLIGIGYSVVVGWIIKFIVGSITGDALTQNSIEYFQHFEGNFSSIPWHAIALTITFAAMTLGISKGIEKLNKIVMPAFFFIFLALAIIIALRPGALEGYAYIFKINFSTLANPSVWICALGQAFFSLSLAGSGTIIYGSYLKKDQNIISCAKNVILFSFISSVLAALVVIPAVFSYDLKENLLSGPPLMFITMPTVFKSLPMGNLISTIFFLGVLFAAITSLVNLFEAPVEAFQAQFGLSRKTSVLIIACISAFVGLLIEDAGTVGLWMDILSTYIVPLGALMAGIMFFWVCNENFAREQVQMGKDKPLGKWFEPMTKYVFIGLVLIICILNIIFQLLDVK